MAIVEFIAGIVDQLIDWGVPMWLIGPLHELLELLGHEHHG